MIDKLLHRIQRKWLKLRLQPIRVFCFHQASEVFDESTMYPGDWMQIADFKNAITSLQEQGYRFISLPGAYTKMRNDKVRIRKYAVLTADDGWASLKEIMPWLEEQKIPITLFVNPPYLDGKHYRMRETEKYLTEDEVQNIHKQYSLVTIGTHGWEHVDAHCQMQKEFADSLSRSLKYLRTLPNFVPFCAYPYGHCTQEAYEATIKQNIVPVILRGNMNYNDIGYIDRECLE